MKKELVERIIDRVCDANLITRDDLFSRTRKREVSESRHLIFLLLLRRGIKNAQIKRIFSNYGHETHHTSILYGARSIESILTYDTNYRKLFAEIENMEDAHENA